MAGRMITRMAAAVALCSLAFAGSQAHAASDLPDWLQQHVGEGDGQIAPVVLRRARDLYERKVREGSVRNPCYFAMDATRPNSGRDGSPGKRFYVVCEAQHTFSAIAAGHGSGRDLDGLASFANDRQCAKNFGNALDSYLTMGGAYLTSDIKTSFKGYFRSAGRDAPLLRRFIQFDGEGETANARERAIGGHASVTLKNVCMKRAPSPTYANADGYVPFGTFTEYVGGRSDGCTSWSLADAPKILSLVERDPTTVYIYPTSADIAAVAQHASGSGAYWNAYCLHEIGGAPRFWSKQTLEPLLARYRSEHPAPPPRPLPLCRSQ